MVLFLVMMSRIKNQTLEVDRQFIYLKKIESFIHNHLNALVSGLWIFFEVCWPSEVWLKFT